MRADLVSIAPMSEGVPEDGLDVGAWVLVKGVVFVDAASIASGRPGRIRGLARFVKTHSQDDLPLPARLIGDDGAGP